MKQGPSDEFKVVKLRKFKNKSRAPSNMIETNNMFDSLNEEECILEECTVKISKTSQTENKKRRNKINQADQLIKCSELTQSHSCDRDGEFKV